MDMSNIYKDMRGGGGGEGVGVGEVHTWNRLNLSNTPA